MKRLTGFLLAIFIVLSLFVVPVVQAEEAEYRTWLQSDSRWGSIPFGTSDTISKSGCAITSIAKLLVHSGAVTDDSSVFNPGIFCTWLKETGGLTSQGWIVWSKAADYSPLFSYGGAVSLTGTKSQKIATIKAYVTDGYVVVVQVKNGGHYVAVDKVSGSTVYIMDPANTGYTDLFSYDAAGVTKIQVYKGPHNGSGGSTGTPTYDTAVDPVGVGTYVITSDDGVNLRSGAGTSYDVLTAIPYNTSVQVTKVKNGWGYTTYNGQSGWFTLEFAKLSPNTLRGLTVTPPTKLTYLVGETLNTAGMIVTALYADGTEKTLKSGYTLTGFSAASAGSCDVYVTYQTKSAVFTVTVEKSAIVYEPGSYVVNSSDGINLRAAPNTTSEIFTALLDKTRVEVTAVKENWGKITYGEFTGWICLDYTLYSPAEVTQVGISAVAKAPCILSGASVSKEHFKVSRLYSDGSTAPITDFTVTLGGFQGNVLPVTITDGEFSAQVTVKVFSSIPMGDPNFDGEINALDALAVLKYAIGKEVLPFHIEVADVNADESIDARDALMILQKAVDKLEQFPAEQLVEEPEQPETETETDEETPERN